MVEEESVVNVVVEAEDKMTATVALETNLDIPIPTVIPVVVVDEEGGEFQCPRDATAGTFTKHPHPADCRLFFLCMNGQVRILASDWFRLIT